MSAISDDRIELLETTSLLVTELTEPENELRVIRQILRAGAWTDPIWVDRCTRVIMDGHHRLHAARELGVARIPCVNLDYSQVTVTSRRSGVSVNPDEIIARGLGRDPYPAKTTRHRLRNSFPMPEMSPLPLHEMRTETFWRHQSAVWSRHPRSCAVAWSGSLGTPTVSNHQLIPGIPPVSGR